MTTSGRALSALLLAAALTAVHSRQCADFKDSERFDCFPEPGSTQQSCQARGCCWQAALDSDGERDSVNVPYCFFPRDFPSYSVDGAPHNDSAGGLVANLSRSAPSGRPQDVARLRLRVSYERRSRLRVRLDDPNARRWEAPLPLDAPGPVRPEASDFLVRLRAQPFGLTVVRRSDGRALFDSASVSAPLIFADQFLQVSSRLRTAHVYGVGEQRRNFTLDLNGAWQRIALWARDQPPTPHVNLYGVHNLMLGLFEDGSAYGVFLLNTNAQEVLLQPLPAITYRTIGGVLDLFILSGPSPMDVVEQYTQLVGRPTMPPYWALGFHLSRYGFKSVDEMNKTLERNLAAKMPLDVMWNDIDYMSKYRDWTYDEVNYKTLPSYVAQVHALNMHYVIIVDPAISNQNPGQYPPYDTGIAHDVFIKKADGSGPIVGKVWPGNTVFPDFTAPQTGAWWYNLAREFHDKIPYDGLWIDMNEPSNFYDGSIEGCPKGNALDFPPYTPGVLDGSLMKKTICPSSLQNLSSHYNLHNMYGYFEAAVTNAVVQKIFPNQRLFILTRSSFAGSGRYTFHWTGDNQATWDNLHYSIGQVLNFNLFGIPFTGADICGFIGDTTEELCTRWMQAGAFYPFMRNHNSLGQREQDPAVWSASAQKAIRAALDLRYSLLPYFYTQLFAAAVNGSAVVRPLLFEFPADPRTHTIDRQFMVGPALLVSPVLAPGATRVTAFLPDSRWCDVESGAPVGVRANYASLAAPLDRINVHLRGGHLLLTKPPAPNTAAQRAAPYGLRACLDEAGRARGELFADDGQSRLERGAFSLVRLSVGGRALIGSAVAARGGNITLGSLWISGVTGAPPSNVTVNGRPAKFEFDARSGLLSVPSMSADLLRPLTVRW